MSEIDDALARVDEIDAALARANDDIDAALARHAQETPEQQVQGYLGEQVQRNTLGAPENREFLNNYGPGLAAAGISVALPPMAPLAAALTGVGLGAASRGAVPLLKGEGTEAALREANPANHPYATAFDFVAPFATKAISNALSARRMSDLPGYEKAVSANADLPHVDELATFKEVGPTVSREAVELNPLQTARVAGMDTGRYLLSRPNPASKIAGETLVGRGELSRQIRNQAGAVVEDAFKGLSVDDAEEMGKLMRKELPDTLVTPTVYDRAMRMRKLLNDLGDRAIASNMMTRAEEGEFAGQLVPFQKWHEGDWFFPRVPAEKSATVKVASLFRGGVKVDRVAHQRTAEEQGAQYVTNAKDAILKYVDKMADDIADAHYFGPPTENAPIGEKAYQLWQQMVEEGDKVGAEAYKGRVLQHLYPRDLTPGEKVANAIAKKTAHVALGQSAVTSWPQIAASPMRFGVGNTLEGSLRYAADPSMRKLYKASGALDPGVTHMAMEAGVPAKTVAARTMAATEHGLRGIGSAGAVPYTEKLVRSAQKAQPSAATLRKLAELRISLEEARGGVTADLVRRVMQRSSDANQLQAHALEHAPAIFDSPYARAIFQFMQYPIAQGRMASDAVVRPILHGIGHAAPSEVALGLGRAARWAPAVAGAAAVGEAAKSFMTGREFKGENVARRAVDTALGFPGMVYNKLQQSHSAGDAVKGILSTPPAVSLAAQTADSAERIFDERNPEPVRGATEVLTDILALFDKTGTAATLRPSVRGFFREQAKR